MKATINGIQVEGTPQEIAELKRLVGETNTYRPNITITPVKPAPFQPCTTTYFASWA